MLDIQMEQANPYYRLDPEIEKQLDISDPENYYGEFTASLLQEQSDKQLLEQIK